MERNRVFDYMKGFGIIAVMIGHYFPHTAIAHLIYSFHMPMFFVISGYFLHTPPPEYSINQLVKRMCKEAIKLILPIIGTILTIIILRTIMGVGIFEGGQFGAFGLGPLWFLVALFWARIILQLISFLCRKTFVIDSPWILLVCSVIVSALAYYFRFMFPYYHICFLHGIIAIQFVAMGWVAQKYKCPIWLQVVFVLFWIIALRYGDLNMVLYEYKCYPLDILGSVGGTLVIYYLSKGMEYLNSQYSKLFRWPCAVINWCGRYSLLILCLHTIDMRALHVISKMISLN